MAYPSYSGFLFDSSDIIQQPLASGSGLNMPNEMEFSGTFYDAYSQQNQNLPRPQGFQHQKHFPKKQTNAQPMKCDLCNISCSSLSAYNDHLAGQKHRKAVTKASFLSNLPDTSEVAPVIPGSTTKASDHRSIIRCKVCDVPCCGPEVYRQHLKGSKHIKKVKLSLQNTPASHATAQTPVASVKSQLQLVSESSEAVSCDDSNGIVGEEQVVATSEAGNVRSFFCKLCNCSLIDIRARLSHLKGRRHQVNYKMRIDASFPVNSTPRQNRYAEQKDAQRAFREEHYRRMDAMAAHFFALDSGLHHFQGPFLQPVQPKPWGYMRPPHNTRLGVDDRYLITKLNEVRMPKDEVNRIYAMAKTCEHAFKLVSDALAQEEDSAQKPPMETTETPDDPVKIETTAGSSETTGKPEEPSKVSGNLKSPVKESIRTVRGVMKVGRLVTGVFLRDDYDFNLVVLVKDKPTWSLLERIATQLSEQLGVLSPDVPYNVQTYDDGCIRVICDVEPKLTCTVSVTSSTIRKLSPDDGALPDEAVKETIVTPDPVDILPIEQCLEALAQVRRAKWFQVRCGKLSNAGTALHVLRSICRQDVRLSVINEWAQELLVEKCTCCSFDRSAAEVLRALFGCLASGVLTSDGPGLYDPCEKDPVDAVGELSAQQREDITFAAQEACRLMAFFQVYKVLGVEKYVKPARNQWPNKKRAATKTANEAEAALEKRPREEPEPDEFIKDEVVSSEESVPLIVSGDTTPLP